MKDGEDEEMFVCFLVLDVGGWEAIGVCSRNHCQTLNMSFDFNNSESSA